MVVVLLQNAWSGYYAGQEWPRDYWIESLIRCRTGIRLKLFLPIEDYDEIREGTRYWIDNTTPICGETANSVVKPDERHVVAMLWQKRPSLVICCGKQAQSVMTKIVGYCHNHETAHVRQFSRIYMPHPAMRLLTNKCREDVRDAVEMHLLYANGNLFHHMYDPFGNRSEIKQ